MMTVAPGDETGLYYIVFASLPWNSSWQRLKDFIRNPQPDGSSINVETVVIYENETNGWASIRGKNHFRAAMTRLNGGIFEGRALVADGRNETHSLVLRDLNLSTVSSSRRYRHEKSSSKMSYQPHQTTPTSSDYSAAECYSTQPAASNFGPVTPIFDPMQYIQQSSPAHDAAQYALQQPMDYFNMSTPAGNVVYAGTMLSTTPFYISPPVPVYSYTWPISYSETPSSPSSTIPSYQPATDSTPVVKTEARKVIITQLPLSTSAAELTEQLVKAISKSNPAGRIQSSAAHNMIHELGIAIHSDGKPKGHALVVLETYNLAQYVINALDGSRYHGRTLHARFAKEGAEPARRHSPQGSSGSQALSPLMDSRRPLTNTSSTWTSDNSSRPSKDERHRYDRRLAPDEIEDDEYEEENIPETSPRSSKGKEPSRHRVTKSEESPRPRENSWSDTPVVADGSSPSRGKDWRGKKHRS